MGELISWWVFIDAVDRTYWHVCLPDVLYVNYSAQQSTVMSVSVCLSVRPSHWATYRAAGGFAGAGVPLGNIQGSRRVCWCGRPIGQHTGQQAGLLLRAWWAVDVDGVLDGTAVLQQTVCMACLWTAVSGSTVTVCNTAFHTDFNWSVCLVYAHLHDNDELLPRAEMCFVIKTTIWVVHFTPKLSNSVFHVNLSSPFSHRFAASLASEWSRCCSKHLGRKRTVHVVAGVRWWLTDDNWCRTVNRLMPSQLYSNVDVSCLNWYLSV